MQVLNQTQLNSDIAIIQLLHGRFGDDLAKCLAYHTGNIEHIRTLNDENFMIGNYLEALNRYVVVGDTTANDLKNVLTVTDIEAIIDDCYRRMNRYNT